MTYAKADFIPFSADAQRSIANLEAAYLQLLDVERQLEVMPSSMFWQNKSGTEYLAVKKATADSGTTRGPRSPETERQLANYLAERDRLQARRASLRSLVQDRVKLCRALRLPQMAEQQGRLLRELDLHGLLGYDVMVVGTNAFAAYEMVCGARFPAGNEATEDFDLAWCRDTGVSLAAMVPPAPHQAASSRSSLMSVLKRIDDSYAINKRKPYQAVNDSGYEVELLAAPSTHPLPRSEPFEPMATLDEQEWLLRGTPVQCVVTTNKPGTCPLYAPDPRWMALHKLWLSLKPERHPSKKGKDARQGKVLLDATRYFLGTSYPMDIDFVLELPPELRDHFAVWAQQSGFDPTNPSAG
jgi:hypothetical protein